MYKLAVEARNGGQTGISVHIYPFRLSVEELAAVENSGLYTGGLLSFWLEIAPMYRYFEENNRLQEFSIHPDGHYIFAE